MVPPVQSSRISGLDDIYEPNQNNAILSDLDFPLTETQQMIIGQPMESFIQPKTEPLDNLPVNHSELRICIPAENEKDLEIIEPENEKDLEIIEPENEKDLEIIEPENENNLEIVRTEIIEIKTTKIYFIKNHKLGEKTKIKKVANTTTIYLSRDELNNKLAKVDKTHNFEKQKTNFAEPIRSPERALEPIKEVERPKRKFSKTFDALRKRPNHSQSEKSNETENVEKIDFTKLFVKEEWPTLTDNSIGKVQYIYLLKNV
jgi:hypothetical protein